MSCRVPNSHDNDDASSSSDAGFDDDYQNPVKEHHC